MAAAALPLLAALAEQVAEVAGHAQGILGRVRGGRVPVGKGVSLLQLRLLLLLHYVTDLGLLLLAKAEGRGLRGLPALPRLLESRVVLEKLRPLEQKLKHHLEKLLRAASGGRGANDPLGFRPAPSNMAAQAEEDEGAGPGGDKAPGLGGGKRYVPPRLVPVQWESSRPPGGASTRERFRALSSDVIKELREELSEEPLELGGGGGERPPPGERHRRHFEESLLLRLRGRGRKGAGPERGGTWSDVTRFRDITPLLANQEEAPPPKKKKRSKVKKGRSKGFRRRRR